jgi:hypothetical protein
VHALPQVMSAVQSASFTHAVFSVQQLVSRQLSHVGSPDESPHVPPDFKCIGPSGIFFRPSAASAASSRTRFEIASFVRQLCGAAVLAGGCVCGAVVSVIVQAKVNVDVMAITPKVVGFMGPPSRCRYLPSPPRRRGEGKLPFMPAPSCQRRARHSSPWKEIH